MRPEGRWKAHSVKMGRGCGMGEHSLKAGVGGECLCEQRGPWDLRMS